MRKLDRLILKSFFGPFFLTTAIATFVLLIQYMLKYFDDFVGKDLGFSVFAELIFYFSLNMLQVALPLGVLVSSLMTFGNLGENFEMTAIKGAGISLLRAMRPIFLFVVVLSIGAYLFNNYVVPAANLKAYSLLYDIKHKKPALDIREGVFYNGIPDYSIKVKEKLSDNVTLKDVIIYDHTAGDGNKTVILADSSRMYMMYNDKYLKLELFNGNFYSEEEKPRNPVDQLYRTSFYRMDLVFSLSSFDLKRTKEELFENNRQMKNISELTRDIDSLSNEIYQARSGFLQNARSFYKYHLKGKLQDRWPVNRTDTLKRSRDSLLQEDDVQKAAFIPGLDNLLSAFMQDTPKFKINKKKLNPLIPQLDRDSLLQIKKDGLTNKERQKREEKEMILDTAGWDFLNGKLKYANEKELARIAKGDAQNIKSNLTSAFVRVDSLNRNIYKYNIEKWKKYSQAFACIVMFLIGAPLGAIIKKGGLGVPMIISIFFFIIYYVLTIMSEKWAREGIINSIFAVWVADIFLFPIGMFFLRQASVDARLFDADVYIIWAEKFRARFLKSRFIIYCFSILSTLNLRFDSKR